MKRIGLYFCCSVSLVVIELIIIIYLATLQRRVESMWMPVDGVSKYPCKNTKDIVVWYEPGLSPEEINRLYVKINKKFLADSVVKLIFDAGVNITFMEEGDNWTSMSLPTGDSMEIRFLELQTGFTFVVKGISPNLISFTINGVENCEPDIGIVNKFAEPENSPKDRHQWYKVSQKSGSVNLPCGRRKIPKETGSIVNGVAKPGDWPWHVAVYVKNDGSFKYACGGTLVSHSYVLTAAQCIELNKATGAVNFTVILGKYNLLSNEQEKIVVIEVERSIIHEYYKSDRLFNDIALLKLKSEVQFTDFIQPVCLWHRRKTNLTNDRIVGSMAGWGFTNDNDLSQPLQQVNLPMVSQETCLKSNPSAFNFVLGDKDFCAGYHNNGTSPCNGDSGGGFLVFIPDEMQDGLSGNVAGLWYIRGILSKGVRNERTHLCDENQYTVFTDVERYADWLDSHLDI